MFDVGDLGGARAGEAFEAVAGRFHDELGGVVGLWNAVAGQLVDHVATALEHGLWDVAGIHSPEQWLGWQCGVGPGKARQVVAVARRYGELPVMAAALRAGELSLDAASIIARRVPPWAEANVVDFAKWATIRQLSNAVNGYGFDPDPGADPDANVRRRVQMGAIDEQRWRMVVETSVDEGAVIEAALVASRDRLFQQQQADRQAQGSDGGDRGTAGDIDWVDALVDMAERATAHDGETRPHAERHKILFHYQTDKAGHPVFTPHGAAPLPESLRHLWTCDGTAAVVQIIDAKPVNVGRTQHIVPRRTRRLVEHRDRGCRVPGCGAARWVQVHHIVHWEHGGPTDTANLICLCPHHHRAHHRGLLAITGNADQPDGVTFCDERGHQIRSAPNARPPQRPVSDEAAQRGIDGSTWHPATGEHLDHWAIELGQPPNHHPATGDRPAPDHPPGTGGPTSGCGDPPTT